jgi:hypothetical protein
MSGRGQTVTLGEPNEGPLVAPLQNFAVLPESAMCGRLPVGKGFVERFCKVGRFCWGGRPPYRIAVPE